MTGGFLDGNIFRGLAFKMVLFLSLAFLPFGIISGIQTREVAQQAIQTAETSLLGLTEQAAGNERASIQEAFGAASALGSVIGLYLYSADGCDEVLSEYLVQAPQYSHVGVVPPDGIMTCSSSGKSMDVDHILGFDVNPATPERRVYAKSDDVFTEQPTLIVTQPFEQGGAFAGHITLSIPVSQVRALARPDMTRDPHDLVTYNVDGTVLFSHRGRAVSQMNLPATRALAAQVGDDPMVFRDTSADGADMVYAVVPIIPNVVYSMSIWREADVAALMGGVDKYRLYLPVLMWLATLIVAFWTLNKLAISHIRKLGRQMRFFAFNRSMPRATMGETAPRELMEMQQAFIGMAESIIRDEAALEDTLRDKNILLKEVHHRVKNNLQLISSIMSMQIRRAQTDDARFVLKRLQERLLSLATVHKNLYQNDALDRVDAGALLEEIVGQMLVMGLPAGSGVKVEQSYDDVQMDSDDAAPLTLLASEAVTNALKYIGSKSDEPARLIVRFQRQDGAHAVFRVANTTGTQDGSDGTGLGSQLINAFARQLNGQVSVSYDAGMHSLELSFPITFREKGQPDF
ncbi:MAG: sensor histidine kinase [Roseobacter sp.]